jgi:predicted O-linked N-acetylglucosamine transferase (SPINDLY family)
VLSDKSKGASLLTAIGHKEWIATTKTEYVQKAVQLANDTEALKKARSTLRTTMKNAPLCDGPKFTRQVEEVFKKLVAKENKRIS